MFGAKTKKIPCYVLIFEQFEIIEKSLRFICEKSNELEIVVIENPSASTPKIKKLIEKMGTRGLISRHYLLDKNITNNAYDVVLSKELPRVKKSPHVIITDGDLTSENTNWLKEEQSILDKHANVFACGISLDKSNLPLVTFPEAKDWIPDDTKVYEDYIETYTGLHLLLMRGRELYSFMQWKQKNKRQFVDGDMHRFCYEQLHKKWSRTKESEAYHLTWDLYADRAHPYTRLKLSKSFEDTWYHNDTSGFVLTNY